MRSSPRLVASLLLSLGLTFALGSSLPAQTCAPGVRGALLLDGIDDYVRIPSNPALDGMSNFTFESWFRATTTGPLFRALFEKGGGSPYLIAAFPQMGAFLNGNLAVQQGPSVFDNVWHHVALTGSANNLTLYLDGQVAGIGTYPSPLGSSPADLYLGASFGGGPFYDHWKGAIDDVRIWNVARTQQQIDANRLYVLAGTEPGLVAYWRFDVAGQTVVNSATATGATLNGTLGPDVGTNPQDPTFTTTDYAPMFYCASGPGQPNSLAARLEVNGLGAGTAPGPFSVQVMGGTTLALAWAGPPNAPFALAFGPLNTNNANFGCIGAIDIGTPPGYSDVGFFLNGVTYPGSLLYVLSNAGTAVQTFSVPQAAVGSYITVQGLVDPLAGACPLVLTAAFLILVI
jgi:Concanavalin A-like lectin/glucanases superfamily